jgi:hypothetical protein
LPESSPHKGCKVKVARELGGKTEVWSKDRSRRYDVESDNIIAEVICRRNNDDQMICVVEYFAKRKGEEIPLGRRSCNDL